MGSDLSQAAALTSTVGFVYNTHEMDGVYTFAVRLVAVPVVACALMCGCTTATDTVAATPWDGPRIRPGIALIVQVGTPTSPPSTMNVLVDQNGDITLPYLLQKPVHCENCSIPALIEKLTKEYAYYLKKPIVTVTFAPYDGKGVSPWGTVTVLGEVGNPGPVNMPATMDLTVTKVLQAAGGCKPFADKTKIRVTRCDKDGNQVRTYVNINEIGRDGRVDKDMSLQPGDVVWVPETWY